MTVVVTANGLQQIQGILSNAKLVRTLGKALSEASASARDMTKKLPAVSAKSTGYDARGIPVDTGRMRQSIQKKRMSLLAAGVFANANYSGFVHDGTSRVKDRPFFKWMLELGGRDKIQFILERHLSNFLRGK